MPPTSRWTPTSREQVTVSPDAQRILVYNARTWRRLKMATRGGDRAAIEAMIGIVRFGPGFRWAAAARSALVEAVANEPAPVSEPGPALEPVLREICAEVDLEPAAAGVLVAGRYAIDLQDVPHGDADWDDVTSGDVRPANW